jgi:probable rRNA maturation factor
MTVPAIEVVLQSASNVDEVPDVDAFERWIGAAVSAVRPGPAQVSVRLVDESESAGLNQRYRQRQGPTNVLSFPFEIPPGAQDAGLEAMLGDLVICAPVVIREAGAQGKPVGAHWAHMAVHGTLHLLGYDHIEPEQAREMETLETKVLAAMGYADPYLESENG